MNEDRSSIYLFVSISSVRQLEGGEKCLSFFFVDFPPFISAVVDFIVSGRFHFLPVASGCRWQSNNSIASRFFHRGGGWVVVFQCSIAEMGTNKSLAVR